MLRTKLWRVINSLLSVAETLNTFFKNAVSTLNIYENSYIVNNESSTILDPMERTIKKYEIHPGILLIKNKKGNEKSFKFEAISVFDIDKEIKTINLKKQHLPEVFHLKYLNWAQRLHTTATTLQELFNESLSNWSFLTNWSLQILHQYFFKKPLWIKQIIDL